MTDDVYDDDSYDEAEADERRRLPNTVLIPAGLFGIVAVTTGAASALNVVADTGRLAAVIYLATLAIASAVTSVGLFRRWRVAHFLAFGIAALLGIGSLTNPTLLLFGVGFAVGVIWSLSTRSAKDWFGFR